MADIVITLTPTAKQEALLAKAVEIINDQQGTSYANATAIIKDVAQSQFRGLIDLAKSSTNESVGAAFRAADPATQDQVRTLLGII